MNKHLSRAGLIILFLFSAIATLFFGYVTFEILVRIARTGRVFTGGKAGAFIFFLPILAILMFRASLHLGRRLWNSSLQEAMVSEQCTCPGCNRCHPLGGSCSRQESDGRCRECKQWRRRCSLIAVGIIVFGSVMMPVFGDLIIYVNTVIAAVLTLVYAIYKHDRNAIRLFIMWVALWIIIPVIEGVSMITLLAITQGWPL